jgi:uncharacterized membrane protein YccC
VGDDIIARLNEVWECATYPWQRNAIDDAKAEIERLHGIVDLGQQLLRESAEANSRLKAEIERLRTALEVAANHMSMTGAPQATIDAIRNAVRGG